MPAHPSPAVQATRIVAVASLLALMARGLALFVWLYFVEGVVRATSDHGVSARCALAQVALVLLLFAACAAQVRLRQRAARAAAAGPAVSH